MSLAMRRGDFDKVKRSDVSDSLARIIHNDLHLWLNEARREWKRVGSPFTVLSGSSFTCDLCGAKLKKVYKVENKRIHTEMFIGSTCESIMLNHLERSYAVLDFSIQEKAKFDELIRQNERLNDLPDLITIPSPEMSEMYLLPEIFVKNINNAKNSLKRKVKNFVQKGKQSNYTKYDIEKSKNQLQNIINKSRHFGESADDTIRLVDAELLENIQEEFSAKQFTEFKQLVRHNQGKLSDVIVTKFATTYVLSRFVSFFQQTLDDNQIRLEVNDRRFTLNFTSKQGQNLQFSLQAELLLNFLGIPKKMSYVNSADFFEIMERHLENTADTSLKLLKKYYSMAPSVQLGWTKIDWMKDINLQKAAKRAEEYIVSKDAEKVDYYLSRVFNNQVEYYISHNGRIFGISLTQAIDKIRHSIIFDSQLKLKEYFLLEEHYKCSSLEEFEDQLYSNYVISHK
ncbi:hypothetical protein KII93_05665 [Leuconostoc gelidum subsp. gasicomitatum]|uniref:hypothetical protein n=1 Tax=Leuconostoc gasicomitatum TaxID=115778 RepID=UPI001CC3AFDF|nr:hypothetical protein [Leuconostoc gasicomitatum]MBZ5947955.1 hypothetical protein [Leuconostoc gasicomitatum]